MEVFEKAFNWLADLSSKLPAINFKAYFIVVVAVLAGIGIIIALTLFGSRAGKIKKASKKISKYLANIESVTDENVSDFTNQCFSAKAPQLLREGWVQYLGVRYGYPSDIINEQSVYDKCVKKNKDVRANVFAGIGLILVALFAFWGFGTLKTVEMSVVHCAGLLLIGIIYLILVILTRSQAKKSLEAFDAMLEDLDAKVNFQVESNYAVDSSPLTELSAMVDEIVARNTSKAVELEEEKEPVIEETPIEALIAQEELEEQGDEVQVEQQEEVAEEQVEETTEEPIAEEVEEEQAEETVESVAENVVEEEPIQEELVEELEEEAPVEEEVQDQEEPVEELVEEQAEEVEEVVEQPQEDDQEELVEDQEEQVEETSEEQEESDEVEQEELEETEQEETEEELEEDVDVEESEEDGEEVADSEEEEFENADDVQGEEEENVVYIVEGEDEEEVVKPSKFVKLPNLVDYMLSKNFSRRVRIQIAGMLLGAYSKTQPHSEDRKIVLNSVAKIIADLQK